MHDALTGLGNRLHLQEVLLARTVTPQSLPFGLLFIDLDGFKTINDTLGHDQGDELLVVIARRLEALLRREDFSARLGGDEFVVLMNEPRQVGDAMLLAGKLLDAISQPVTLGSQVVSLTASIGVALYPEHASGPHGLLKAADAAMYEPRRAGATAPPCSTRPSATAWPSTCSSNRACAGRSSWINWPCTGSRWSTCAAARCWAPRRCCAGSIRCSARWHRIASFRWPKPPA